MCDDPHRRPSSAYNVRFISVNVGTSEEDPAGDFYNAIDKIVEYFRINRKLPDARIVAALHLKLSALQPLASTVIPDTNATQYSKDLAAGLLSK